MAQDKLRQELGYTDPGFFNFKLQHAQKQQAKQAEGQTTIDKAFKKAKK
jgi:hypothetical protein